MTDDRIRGLKKALGTGGTGQMNKTTRDAIRKKEKERSLSPHDGTLTKEIMKAIAG